MLNVGKNLNGLRGLWSMKSSEIYSIEKIDSSQERRFLIAMIIDNTFLTEAIDIVDSNCLQVPAYRLGYNMCLKYFKQHGKAPGNHFRDLYDVEIRNGRIPEDMIGEFGSIYASLSREFVEGYSINRDYLINQLKHFIRSRSLKNLSQDIESLISLDKIDEAELLLNKYNPIKGAGIDWSDPVNLTDTEFTQLEDKEDILFQYPGALGELMGPVERGSFIAFQGPEKRGKTSYLWEMAIRSLFGRNKTVFISCGDMNLKQNWRRFYGWILKSSIKMQGREVIYPLLDCKWCQLGSCPDVDQEPIMSDTGTLFNFKDRDPSFHKVCTRCKLEDPKRFRGARWYEKRIVPEYSEFEARKKWKNLYEKAFLNQNLLRLKCYPNNHANVDVIRNLLKSWELRDDWVADTIVIDYADNLGNEPDCRFGEKRHQIDATWGAMRGLALERNVAVITATQAGRSAFQKANQDESDTSEDKRKLGHVTQMLTLNQTPEEKKMGMMRIGVLNDRDSYFDIRDNVVCLQCAAMSRPVLDSYWLR